MKSDLFSEDSCANKVRVVWCWSRYQRKVALFEIDVCF